MSDITILTHCRCGIPLETPIEIETATCLPCLLGSVPIDRDPAREADRDTIADEPPPPETGLYCAACGLELHEDEAICPLCRAVLWVAS